MFKENYIDKNSEYYQEVYLKDLLEKSIPKKNIKEFKKFVNRVCECRASLKLLLFCAGGSAYENYKEVNLPWIKKIPSHWNIEKINALFSERKEKNLGSHEKFILSVMKDKGVIPYTEKGNVGNKASEKLKTIN